MLYQLVKKLHVPCLAFLLLAGGFDLACTLAAHNGGWLQEMNPVADHVLKSGGRTGLVAFKVSVTFVACAAMWLAVRRGCRQPKVVLTGIAVAVGTYAWLTVHWLRCLAEFLSTTAS